MTAERRCRGEFIHVSVCGLLSLGIHAFLFSGVLGFGIHRGTNRSGALTLELVSSGALSEAPGTDMQNYSSRIREKVENHATDKVGNLAKKAPGRREDVATIETPTAVKASPATREKLAFDKSPGTEFSTSTATASGEKNLGARASSVGGHSASGLRRSYEALLLSRLARFKRYPPEARRRRIEGRLLLFVEVERSGELVSGRLIKSSGSDILDREAHRMLVRAAPFPPFPVSYPADRARFIVPLRFRLN